MVDLSRVAVFARNWPDYLKEAAGAGRGRKLAYQSKLRWVTAGQAVEAAGPRTIYLAPIGGKAEVTHRAKLVQVLVDPPQRGAATRRALRHRLHAKRREEPLWGRTIYVIQDCRKLPKPMPMSKLSLALANKSLSRAYRYSYAVVEEQ